LPLNVSDVVGQDGEEAAFVAHTGLAESGGLQTTESVAVIEMGPPLHGPGSARQIRAHVVGSADLTHDELQKIRRFVDQHASEHLVFEELGIVGVINAAPLMYCVLPHACPFEEEDGRYARMRFSCAGFVLEAYQSARIQLIVTNRLPPVDLDVLNRGYPRLMRLVRAGRLAQEELGLTGSGPWPVVMCGYLFHALNRDADSIRRQPYQPGPDDWYFR
jgi:hypothetical protein